MAKKKNRQRNQMLIVGGVMAVMAIGVGVVAMTSLGGGATQEPPAVAKDAPPSPPDQPAPPAEPEPVGPPLVDDNGRTLWASPTDGEAIALDFLPPDCQLFLHLRPQEMNADLQAVRAMNALGPAGKRIVSQAESLIGLPLNQVRQLTVGVRPGVGETLEATLVVELSGPDIGRRGRDAEHAGESYKVLGDWCLYSPPSTNTGALLVFAKRPAMHEVLDAGGAPPPLRREMEQVVLASDADRHASLLVAPSFLFTEGRSLFTGDSAALRSPLFEETPDDLRAALVSLHWDGDRFYWEIKAAPAADTTAKRLSVTLDQRVDRWPNEVQLAVLDANPAPHGRRVVAQLPLMMGVAAKLARAGVEQRHAVVNGYLPAAAGHNLLLAAELLLAQQSAGAGFAGTGAASGSVAGRTAPPPVAKTASEKLQSRATVTFARDTLEMAVKYLSDEIGVPIVIVGDDLQLEGITKNQSFGLDAQNLPAEQVLIQILTRANPDKTATGPQDPKQKLVYVIRKEGEGETIYITTRSSAAKRMEALPAVFNS